jgi:hypothetical protein
MDKNTTTSFPKEWPGAFAIYKLSRERVRQNLEPLILLAVLPIGLNFVIGFVLGMIMDTNTANGLSQCASFVISVYFTVVTTRAYLLAARKKQVNFEQALKIPSSLFWRMLLLNLLVIVSVVGGMVLLIVPGIIIALRLSQATYYLVDQDLGVREAYKASWNATKGHLGKLWGLIGVGFLMLLPAITIIGIIATIYLFFMYSLAAALFYMHLQKVHKAVPAEDAAPAEAK